MEDLTASEITSLLTSFLNNTMAVVVTTDFLEKATDLSVRKMLQSALELATDEVRGAEQFLTNDQRALPEPFTEKDVDIQGPKYLSDDFVLLLKYRLAQDALPVYSLALSGSLHPEIRAFYKNCLCRTAELVDECATILIKKGMYHPVIHIPRTNESEKIHSQAFFGKFFGKNRVLSAPEAFQFVYNYHSMEVLRELFRSFSQTNSADIKAHFRRGEEMASKHLNLIQVMLEKNELPQLPTWECEVPIGGRAPFSDWLMLNKISMLCSATATQYGVSASSTLRRDVGLDFLKLMGEVLLYAEDTGNLMVKHHMLDQPPLVSSKEHR